MNSLDIKPNSRVNDQTFENHYLDLMNDHPEMHETFRSLVAMLLFDEKISEDTSDFLNAHLDRKEFDCPEKELDK